MTQSTKRINLCVFLGMFLTAMFMGCSTTSAEKFNRKMAQEEYKKDHSECWRLFSRIDPQRKKEYQACMKKRGWNIN